MDNVPTEIEGEPTVKVPFLTMVELVNGCDEDEPPVCQVCADRGTVHVPEGDL